jgi:tetratricopeptide (TPR) repeat protein
LFRRNSSTAASLILAAFAAFNAPLCAHAGDFPGIGDPAGWSDALPYYNRGNRYLNNGRPEDAMRDFQEAITKYPYDADFHINLGVAFQKLEDYGAAEQAFKAAIKLKPKDWSGWNNLGNAYLKQDRLKDTVAAYEHALKCNPPAADKAAIMRDLADIHKLLRATGQEPLPTPPGTKIATKSKTPAKKQAPATAAPPAPAKPAQSKDWGYE